MLKALLIFTSVLAGAERPPIFPEPQQMKVTGSDFSVTEGMPINADSYASAFYLTTGFHALHVTGGLIAILLIIGRTFTTRRYTHAQATGAVVTSYYWHFVDVVWIALFAIIYLLK